MCYMSLNETKEYTLFTTTPVGAKKVHASVSVMCAVGCRKALELAVK